MTMNFISIFATVFVYQREITKHKTEVKGGNTKSNKYGKKCCVFGSHNPPNSLFVTIYCLSHEVVKLPHAQYILIAQIWP